MTPEQYKNDIKKYLRQGMIVVAPRQSGKTTAILEVAKEILDGGLSVAIQGSGEAIKSYGNALWDKLFADDGPRPIFFVNPKVVNVDRVLVDEKSLCQSVYKDFFAATDSGWPSALYGRLLASEAVSGAKLSPGRVVAVLPMFTWEPY
jgi:hypothetical protein